LFPDPDPESAAGEMQGPPEERSAMHALQGRAGLDWIGTLNRTESMDRLNCTWSTRISADSSGGRGREKTQRGVAA
jgi:hypothetical protein